MWRFCAKILDYVLFYCCCKFKSCRISCIGYFAYNAHLGVHFFIALLFYTNSLFDLECFVSDKWIIPNRYRYVIWHGTLFLTIYHIIVAVFRCCCNIFVIISFVCCSFVVYISRSESKNHNFHRSSWSLLWCFL